MSAWCWMQYALEWWHLLFFSGDERLQMRLREKMLEGRQSIRPESEIQPVLYALSAFSDEYIAKERISLRDGWLQNPLQTGETGTHTAGEQFFVEARSVLENKALPDSIVWVYGMTLQLGFRGGLSEEEVSRLKNQFALRFVEKEKKDKASVHSFFKKHGFKSLCWGVALSIGLGVLYAGHRVRVTHDYLQRVMFSPNEPRF